MSLIRITILFVLTSVVAFSQGSRTEDLIRKLSKEKFSYMNAQNLEKLATFLDDRLVFVHSNGLTENKEELLKNLEKGKWDIVDVKTNGVPSVRVFKNDMAIVVGKGSFDIHAEGKSMTIELIYTEVWTHYKKGWKLVSRHANRL
jgi:ABC-type transporter MlaC component